MGNLANYLTIIQMHHLFNTTTPHPANQMQEKMQSCPYNLFVETRPVSSHCNCRVFTNQLLKVCPQIFLKIVINIPIYTVSRYLFPKLKSCHICLHVIFWQFWHFTDCLTDYNNMLYLLSTFNVPHALLTSFTCLLHLTLTQTPCFRCQESLLHKGNCHLERGRVCQGPRIQYVASSAGIHTKNSRF